VTGRRPRYAALASVLGALVLAVLACNAPGFGGDGGGTDFPSVTISAPQNGTRVLLGREVVVESTATHPNGVSRVELWVDGARYRSDDNPVPAQRRYTLAQAWSASTPGQHVLEVRVYGNSETAAAAAQVVVEVVSDVGQLTGTPGRLETPSPGPSVTPAQTPTGTGTPTATVTPTPTPTLAGMIFIPPGQFLMGSAIGEGDEQPERQVLLAGYAIDRTEVTVAQFKAFVQATGYRTTAEQRGDPNNWRQFDTAGRQGHPVRWMSWVDARAYCSWAGGRLPTEAEWEKAARGTDGRTYPWGNAFNAGLIPHGDTVVAGSLANASPYGVYDLAGNVWEWVADWYSASYYASSPPASNPPGPGSGVARVLRGGGYNNDLTALRVTNRHNGGPEGYAPDHGFRCAR
jgi:formylglycine-generating enzyme required for sulfatase activity